MDRSDCGEIESLVSVREVRERFASFLGEGECSRAGCQGAAGLACIAEPLKCEKFPNNPQLTAHLIPPEVPPAILWAKCEIQGEGLFEASFAVRDIRQPAAYPKELVLLLGRAQELRGSCIRCLCPLQFARKNQVAGKTQVEKGIDRFVGNGIPVCQEAFMEWQRLLREASVREEERMQDARTHQSSIFVKRRVGLFGALDFLKGFPEPAQIVKASRAHVRPEGQLEIPERHREIKEWSCRSEVLQRFRGSPVSKAEIGKIGPDRTLNPWPLKGAPALTFIEHGFRPMNEPTGPRHVRAKCIAGTVERGDHVLL